MLQRREVRAWREPGRFVLWPHGRQILILLKLHHERCLYFLLLGRRITASSVVWCLRVACNLVVHCYRLKFPIACILSAGLAILSPNRVPSPNILTPRCPLSCPCLPLLTLVVPLFPPSCISRRARRSSSPRRSGRVGYLATSQGPAPQQKSCLSPSRQDIPRRPSLVFWLSCGGLAAMRAIRRGVEDTRRQGGRAPRALSIREPLISSSSKC
ncbi:hypothetical protein FN846DRAFT_971362 [Sphaerosporella brunnea]|uniref:Uncharacterized protein n=1 Tax=Sphaerosporella brunnea TaxID=1250544 RepID=A0A5J5EH81_9PEZI|nr:hypothetical protein FN846DRAFT_971362 [Sphaerosporella brunnea]